MRRFLAARRGSFRPLRPGVVAGLVLLAVIAIAVTPTPRASAEVLFWQRVCKATLNVTGTQNQEVTLEHASTWDTDHWAEPVSTYTRAAESFKAVRGPTVQSYWKSESAYHRGCSTTVRYRWPGGSAELKMTFDWDGQTSANCTPSGDVKACNYTGKIYDTDLAFNVRDLVVDWHLALP
jgi:hypothetical protein